jgi:hypothetical protein
MPARVQAHVAPRDRVRLYDEHGEWFSPGTVTDVDHRTGFAVVDYGDWVQRYPLEDLQVFWPDDGTYERALVPLTTGETLEDYREEDEPAFA